MQSSINERAIRSAVWIALGFGLVCNVSAAAQPGSPLRVLVLTGGHAYEREEFFAMFPKMKAVKVTHAEFKRGAEDKLAPASKRDYDAMLFYDTTQNPEPHWNSWMQLLEEGMPTIFLHHALGEYRTKWEHLDVVGGHAFFTPEVLPAQISTVFSEHEQIPVHIADPDHPITRGVSDFTIADETYRGAYVRPDVHVLLTTTHPKNDYILAWTHRFKNSPIVYLQLGHGKEAYENPNFVKLLEQSLKWASAQQYR